MKKLFFITAILCAVFCSSCSKDESFQDSSLFVRSIEFGNLSKSGEKSELSDIIYDEKGRVKQAAADCLGPNHKFNFSYNDNNTMTISCSDVSTPSYHIQLNEKGYVSKIEWQWLERTIVMDYICEITYDNNGYILSITLEQYRNGQDDGVDYYQYVWEGGNLIRINEYDSFYGEEVDRNYRYTEYENNLNIDVNNIVSIYGHPDAVFDILGAFNFFGKRSKNLVDRYVGYESAHHSGYGRKYSYYFNENNILSEVRFPAYPNSPEYGIDYLKFKY